jgi:hypothetical protein
MHKVKKKILILFGSSVSFILIAWIILVVFSPVVIIDGRPYSQQEIFQLRDRCVEYYTQRLELLSTEANNIIESEFSNYMNNLGELTSVYKNNVQLSSILKIAYIDMNIAEEQFISELEHILQYKRKIFTVPLRVRNITHKEVVLQDIFSTNILSYSVNNLIYDRITIDILNKNLMLFQNEFPKTAGAVIENTINSQYEQCLRNLSSQIDMDAGINNAVQDTVSYLRIQGETLCFLNILWKNVI